MLGTAARRGLALGPLRAPRSRRRRGKPRAPSRGCEVALVKPCRRPVFAAAAAGLTEQTPGSPALGVLSSPGPLLGFPWPVHRSFRGTARHPPTPPSLRCPSARHRVPVPRGMAAVTRSAARPPTPHHQYPPSPRPVADAARAGRPAQRPPAVLPLCGGGDLRAPPHRPGCGREAGSPSPRPARQPFPGDRFPATRAGPAGASRRHQGAPALPPRTGCPQRAAPGAPGSRVARPGRPARNVAASAPRSSISLPVRGAAPSVVTAASPERRGGARPHPTRLVSACSAVVGNACPSKEKNTKACLHRCRDCYWECPFS